MRWDIFCRVIDNFGDIGVCWRLAADLASRGQTVRLWIDDARALDWMAPGARQGRWPGIGVHDWKDAERPDGAKAITATAPADVWIEGFGCEIPEAFVAARFAGAATPPRWINLEYLSAEAYVERAHGLPSPVQHGPARGHLKHFFYPGFTPRTGGLLREPDLPVRQQAFQAQDKAPWLQALGVVWTGAPLVSMFCYEPEAMDSLLAQWSTDGTERQVLVTPGRAAGCIRAALAHAPGAATANEHPTTRQIRLGGLTLDFLPPLPQPTFDQLLWACDLNFVRGEDSLVRAIWAGQACVWQAYPQQDGAHAQKLDAWLEQLQAGARLRQAHQHWNGLVPSGRDDGFWSAAWTERSGWRDQVLALRNRLQQQEDLASQLLVFAQKTR